MAPEQAPMADWIAGWCLGSFFAAHGPKVILKNGVWVRTKAVHHDPELPGSIQWDDETRAISSRRIRPTKMGTLARRRSMLGGGA